MAHPQSRNLPERLYDALFDEDDEGRACDSIPPEACRDAPRNFFLNAANGAASKLAEQLASPGIVLPWVLSAIGAPVFVSGLLVPIRRAAALLPQLSISARIRAMPVRKKAWVGAAVLQAAALAAMAGAVVFFQGLAGGLAVAFFLAIYSLGRGVCSVTFKDVLAKTIPQGRRGRLLGARATSGGVLTLGAGVLLFLLVRNSSSTLPYVLLLSGAAVLWATAAILFALITEQPGATEGGRNALSEMKLAMVLLREDWNLVRFIGVRILLLSISLLQPFYVLHGSAVTGGQFGALALFIVANGLANLLSSPLWGRFSDRSSRKVMAAAAVIAIITGAYALAFPYFPRALQTSAFYMPVFFLNGIALAGARLGRKTYFVDYAPPDRRPTYVAVSNTIVGLLTLATAGYGAIADAISVPVLILVLLVFLAGAGVLALRLTQVESAA